MTQPYGLTTRVLNVVRTFTARRPTYVVLFVTGRCNSRCRMCFNWQLAEDAGMREELTVEEYEQIAKSLGHVQQLTLSGGEPSLRDDLVDIVRAFYRRNRIPQVTYPTNGLMPERIQRQVRELCESCPRTVFKMSVSIDGIGELHDNIRGLPGSFEKALHTYDLLDELRHEYPNMTLSSCTTFSALNQDVIEDVLAYKASRMDLDAKGLTLERGDVRDPATLQFSRERYRELLPRIAELTRDLKSEPESWAFRSLYRLTSERTLARLDQARRSEPCVAGRRGIVITDIGDVLPCEPLNVSLGNLRDNGYDVMRVLGSEKAQEVLRSISAGECTCTWECAILSSLVFSPREYPR
ncbi:MAG: radical SAM protein, partial [Methanopyri archaeon]|nr:radical SAM protein [Methanopyri archaeon]